MVAGSSYHYLEKSVCVTITAQKSLPSVTDTSMSYLVVFQIKDVQARTKISTAKQLYLVVCVQVVRFSWSKFNPLRYHVNPRTPRHWQPCRYGWWKTTAETRPISLKRVARLRCAPGVRSGTLSLYDALREDLCISDHSAPRSPQGVLLPRSTT